MKIFIYRNKLIYLLLLIINIIKMFNSMVVQKLPVKIILIVLIVLEIAVLALTYRIEFDDYIALVVIVLSIFIAYFGFQYLKAAFRTTKTYEAVSASTRQNQISDYTQQEIQRLVESPQYKQYEKNLMNKSLRNAGEQINDVEGESEEQKKDKDDKDVDQFLEELQRNIFDM